MEIRFFVASGTWRALLRTRLQQGVGINRSAKTRNLHTCPISHMDLIGAIIGIVHSELVELTSNVVGGTGVDVPIVVGAV
jgi:hypothetical protein